MRKPRASCTYCMHVRIYKSYIYPGPALGKLRLGPREMSDQERTQMKSCIHIYDFFCVRDQGLLRVNPGPRWNTRPSESGVYEQPPRAAYIYNDFFCVRS